MSEYSLVWQGSTGLLGVVVASLLYSLGGRAIKALRRYGASFVLALTVNILCVLQGVWNPWLIAIWPILIGAFSLGYGGDYFGEKLLKRAIYAFGVCMGGMLCALVLGGNAWFVLIPHVGVGAWSIWLGIKSNLPTAIEEIFVCLILNSFLVAYPFVI